MISFLPFVSKLILTFTDDFIGKGKAVSSTRLLGRYTKYRPSFLVKILPLLVLTNYITPVTYLLYISTYNNVI
jgi:hypothetical protein